MSINFSILSGNPYQNHQEYFTQLMGEGLQKQGCNYITKWNDPAVDFILTWGWKPYATNGHWKILKNFQKPIMVMERGYLGDRFAWTSVGWNGLNGNANFCNNAVTDSQRFNNNFGKLLLPWKDLESLKNLPVLLIGQVSHDAAVQHININHWYMTQAKALLSMGENVIFREHPLNKLPSQYLEYLKGDIIIDKTIKLEETLEQCKAVVTFNSNSGVIGVLNGIPTVALDKGSMVYGLVPNSLNNLSATPERRDWANKIAYTQWTEEEIRNGLPWETLKLRFITD